jgi:uncharacterized protein YjiS (DUF1127 family)
MSTTVSTIVRPGVTKRPGAFSRLLNAYCEGIARYFVRRAAIASLHKLDDRALRDIGINRSQIEAAVDGFITRSSAAMGPRANARPRAPTTEAAPWS